MKEKVLAEQKQLLFKLIEFCMDKNYLDARNEILAFQQMMAPYAVDSDLEISVYGNEQHLRAENLIHVIRDTERLDLALSSSGETLNGIPLVVQGMDCCIKSLINGELTAVLANDPEKMLQISVDKLSGTELAMLAKRTAEKLSVTENLFYFPVLRGDFLHAAAYCVDETQKRKSSEMITDYFEMKYNAAGTAPEDFKKLQEKYEKLKEFQHFMQKVKQRGEFLKRKH